MPSAFTFHGTCTHADSLALLQLKRDLITPVRLSSDANALLNTRFGSYPHTTLLGIPWGSQVRASRVAGLSGKRVKRQRTNDGQQATQNDGEETAEELVILGTAEAGFAHVLPPTPELWTQSLPHRTQVVYTPDYSYVLQRLRVGPGSVIIEAGAGSGSFTHAAARAVDGEQSHETTAHDGVSQELSRQSARSASVGRVYSYEYHQPRAEQLISEIQDHGLDDIVTVTHRDVYEDGFLIEPSPSSPGENATLAQPKATAVFLDLPAPWLALRHLTRQPEARIGNTDTSISALSPHHTVYICTFSPCIEQVQQTISELARLGWSAIETVTLGHHDIMVRRERVGVAEEGSRDGNPMPATVDEAMAHLRSTRENEEQARQRMIAREAKGERKRGSGKADNGKTGKEKRVESLMEGRKGRSLWREGRLATRTEGELKGHTSFLTFAILPRVWTDADEAEAVSEVQGAFCRTAGLGKNRSRVTGDVPVAVQ